MYVLNTKHAQNEHKYTDSNASIWENKLSTKVYITNWEHLYTISQ